MGLHSLLMGLMQTPRNCRQIMAVVNYALAAMISILKDVLDNVAYARAHNSNH